MRRRVLIAVLVCLAVSLPLALRLAGRTAQASTPEEWQERISACVSGKVTVNKLLGAGFQTCLRDIMVDAVEDDTDTMMNMQAGLAAQIEASPELYYACHTVGHEAGQRAYERYQDIAMLLLVNLTDTCQYAIGHGILDGFALADPSDEQFAAAARACSSISEAGEELHQVFGLCSDGLGHAAWTSTQDVVAAAMRCQMLEHDESQQLCGEGVIMQIYEPAGTEPSADVATAHETMPSMCTNWPGTSATRIGCWRGAGYAYSRTGWNLYYNGETPPGQPMTPGDRELMWDAMFTAVDHCRLHPESEGVSNCLRSLAMQIPISIYLDTAFTDELCAEFGEWEDLCRDFRFDIG